MNPELPGPLVSTFASPEPVEPCDQPFKLGLWATENIRVSRWHLSPGQRIVTHAHPRADDLVVVLHGDGHYLSFEDVTPSPAMRYVPEPCKVVVPPAQRPDHTCCHMIPVSTGHVVIARQGTFHGLVNTGDHELVAVVATGPDIRDTEYVVR